jgi:four helix bundle protein
MAGSNLHGIDERAFDFFCGVIRFVRTIQPEPGVRRLADQMVAAAGSIAANREEATSGSSRKEFIRYNEIALRSAKESVVWPAFDLCPLPFDLCPLTSALCPLPFP